jgi:hypothetical protein
MADDQPPGEWGESAADAQASRLATLYPELPQKGGETETPEQQDNETAAPVGVPTSYQLTPPDGFEINDEIVAEFDPVFRELGLNNDQANKLMPLAGRLIERITSANEDEFTALRADWARRTKADAQIGGANWPETARLVGRALDAAGSPRGSEFRQYLDETGLGNHPEMVRIFRYFGTLVDRSAQTPTTPQDRSAILYGNSTTGA